MEFEYDPAKSLTNKDKHGLDFEEAKALWRDEDHIVIDARLRGEPRSMAIGLIGEKLWSVVFTNRGGRVRIISARRARKEEAAIYEDE
jgi:uncharacterized DUF497 family protein